MDEPRQSGEGAAPTDWFDELYRAADGRSDVPWADGRPNPHLVEWLDAGTFEAGDSVLVVGCGLGDDAVELSRRGFDVTAFDVSPTAIEWCRTRFVDADVEFKVADLFDPPAAWRGAFDCVIEVYTLQALPAAHRERALAAIASFVAPGGILLVICRGRDPDEAVEGPPWPLARSEVMAAEADGLCLDSFEQFMDDEQPSVRRFRATFERPSE